MKRKRIRSVWPKIFKGFLKWADSSIRQVLIIAVLALGFMQYTGFKWDKKIARQIDEKTPLMSNEDARLLVDTMRQLIAIQQKDKETKVYTGVRKASVTKLDSGEIKLDIPTRGWTIEPGLVIGTGEALRVGADVQYAYWKRWGPTVGVTIPVQNRTISNIRGHLGLSWSPYWRFAPNTSIWGGLDTNKEPIFGLRTRF